MHDGHMHLKDRLHALTDFLKANAKIWQEEVIHGHPKSLDHYPPEWPEALDRAGEEGAWHFDCRRYDSLDLPASLQQWLEKIKELNQIEDLELSPLEQLPSWAFSHVSLKKQHEIERVVAAIAHRKKGISHIVDLGGGQGHLARILALYYGHTVHSIDRSHEFQELGKKRLAKYPHPESAGSLHFHHGIFGEKFEDKNALFNTKSLSLGLHTCGPLANWHLQKSIENNCPLILNFGCCYSSCDPQKDTLLSSYTREYCALPINKYALTLATRGHTQITRRAFDDKCQVKRYRYGLHLYLLENGLATEFETVGSSPLRHYYAPFSTYALQKFEKLGIEKSAKHERELQLFYDDQKTQDLIQRLFLANLIRWQLGRSLELYLLIDRALWVEDLGREAKLYRFFDEELSPRNIGIMIEK
jgi:hypothetical protein